MPSLVSVGVGLGLRLGAVLDLQRGGTSGCTALTSCADEVPSFAWIEMPSKAPSLCSSACAVVRSKIAMRRAAERVDVAERGDAGDS